MQHTRDTSTPRRGTVVRARYRGGTVRGTVIDVREEPGGERRVVLRPFGEDTELDTSIARIDVLDGEVCPACETVVERGTYRCPDCGADLVRD